MTFLEFLGIAGIKPTAAQRVLWGVAVDGMEPGESEGEDRSIARKIFGDVETVPEICRAVIVMVLGARSGKTLFSSLYLLWRALTADLSMLHAGEKAVALAVGPDMRLARQLLSFALGTAKQIGFIKKLIVSESADGFVIKRTDGRLVSIECLPATRGGSALRGRSLVAAVLEEACFFRDESAVVNDQDIYKSVAPRVLPGGLVLIVSTPFAQSGLVWDFYKSDWSTPSTALVAHAGTLLMNPSKQPEVERERLRDPGNASMEFDAVFAQSEEALLTTADVDAMIDRGVLRRNPMTGVSGWSLRYSIGLDVGLRHDCSDIVVVHHERGADGLDRVVVDCVEHLAPAEYGGRIPLQAVEDAVVRLSEEYGGADVWHDGHLSDALAPALEKRGVTCHEAKMSSAPQAERASLLVQRARTGLLRLVDHPVLEKQLKELRITRHAGGRLSVAAPNRRGAHDDATDALLLALEAATERSAEVPAESLTPGELLAKGIERRQQRAMMEEYFGAVPASMYSPREREKMEIAAMLEELKLGCDYVAAGGVLPLI